MTQPEPRRVRSDDALTTRRYRRRAWKLGRLKWKLHPYQDSVYDASWSMITDPSCLQGNLTISRQFGKTHTLLVIATELCLRKRNAQVRFAAPTAKELKARTLPIMRTILRDCPKDLRPRWNGSDRTWTFPSTGAQIHIVGVNNDHADDLRGAACDLAIVDEAGFCDEFKYLVDSVLLPQLLTTRGTLLCSSTPPRSMAHDYFKWAMSRKSEGFFVHRTIYDTGRDEAEIALYANACGGKETATWRREYLAEFVVDETLVIVPEWRADYVRVHAADDPFRRFWHNYSAMDIGESKTDFTAVLFGFYHFTEARLYIEDELIDRKLPRMSTAELEAEIRKRERALWLPADAPPDVRPTVYRRIADNNATELLVDLAAGDVQKGIRGTPFYPTSKDELYAMVNNLRLWVRLGRVVVHPRCTNLITCLEQGIWKDEDYIGRDFDRNTDCGHLDALAALIYLVRNIDVQCPCPVPADFGLSATTHHLPQPSVSQRSGRKAPPPKVDPRRKEIAKILGPKKRVA